MDTIRFEKEDIDIIAELMIEGSVIAFPTDTVFGLGVIYDNEEALQNLKDAKGRPENKPIPTMVSSIEQMESIAELNENAIKLAEAFMPGAITLILKKKASTPDYVSNGLDTIGIRMPEDDFVLELIEKCEKPLLVTSANLSGEETGVTSKQVLAQLDGRIDAIVVGEAESMQASTIVDVSGEDVVIIRPGPIQESEIIQIINS